MARPTGMWKTELALHAEGYRYVAGVDEAGRGPLAGPVVAAAAVLPPRVRLPGLADSKVLTPEARERLYHLIHQKALAVGVGVADVPTIEAINIHRATLQAMRAAVGQLRPVPHLLLVDGRTPLSRCVPQRAIVDGDATCACIAAASILAKVTRDRMMEELEAQYPGYGFAQHKGYGTREHLARLRALGPCPAHRLSFAPVRLLFQTELPFDELDVQEP